MTSLPMEIISILMFFSQEFTKPTWKHVKLLCIGAILCRGARRITSILRVLGLSDEKRFEKYHRVLNRAKWNSLNISKILFGLLIALLPADHPILIIADETIERRKGKKIKAKGCYRDAVRSSRSTVVKCFGLKWNCMALLVKLPFCARYWALPFMTVLEPSKKANEQQNKKHKTSIDWTITMINIVSRWLKKKSWVLLGDGGYACIRLAHKCIIKNVTLISRLRLDACVYEFTEVVPLGKRGRKPIKGSRIKLTKFATDNNHLWKEQVISWYGGEKKTIKIMSKTCLWYKSGETPLPIKFVLVCNPDQSDKKYEVFFSTDLTLDAEKIIEWFVLRWNIEVTFEEARAHLGVETQRQWSDKAIARTTPLLFGLFSMVTLMANKLRQVNELIPLSTAWYNKNSEAAFSDVLTFVRRAIIKQNYFYESTNEPEFVKIKRSDFKMLMNQLTMAA